MRTKMVADPTHPSNPSPPGRTWERLAVYLSIYALTVLLTSLLWQRPATLTLAYALISLSLLWRSHSRSEVAYFGLAALLGPMGEFVAVGFGAWEYSLPLVRIPVWLPLAYGIVGLGLYKLAGLLLQIQPRSASNSLQPFQGAPASALGRCARPSGIAMRNGRTDPQSTGCLDLSASQM